MWLFEAAKSGKILIDSDMTLLDNGIEVYVYKDEQAKEDLAKMIIIEDLVIIPTELQKAIRVGSLVRPSTDSP
eukprot:symbB.v1.2.019983.t1/scaffold1654.1/size107508/8